MLTAKIEDFIHIVTLTAIYKKKLLLFQVGRLYKSLKINSPLQSNNIINIALTASYNYNIIMKLIYNLFNRNIDTGQYKK